MIVYHVAPSLFEIAYGRSDEQHMNTYLVATELLNRRLNELHQARTHNTDVRTHIINKHDTDNRNNGNNGNGNKWSIFFAYACLCA